MKWDVNVYPIPGEMENFVRHTTSGEHVRHTTSGEHVRHTTSGEHVRHTTSGKHVRHTTSVEHVILSSKILPVVNTLFYQVKSAGKKYFTSNYSWFHLYS